MTLKTNCVLHHIAVENQHDMEAMCATLDQTDSIRDEVAGLCYRGIEAVAERYAALWRAFPDFCVVPRRFLEDGDTVVLVADYSGTHLGPYGPYAPTGKKFAVRLVNLIDFRGDKINRETIYVDQASQLRQLGLLPRADNTTKD